MTKLVRWARDEDNIRAVALIGSRARIDCPADEWADLDVIILARDPEPYWATTDWLCNVGIPWLTFVEPTPDGNGFERRVLFEGGLDVDFAPDPVAGFERMLDQGFAPDIADMVRRGVRFLVDKDGLSERLQDAQVDPPAPSVPAEREFLNLVHDFWFHTVWTGKHLRRGELWRAKSCCDTYLKGLLLRMLEWHARASRGPHTDTWMGGRFLEDWADPRALADLPAAFARYEKQDIWRALEATMDLFHRLAVETAARWAYAYPSFGEERARDLVRRMRSGKSLW
jgi:aminoglycoside 6-adenylyltransferase